MSFPRIGQETSLQGFPTRLDATLEDTQARELFPKFPIGLDLVHQYAVLRLADIELGDAVTQTNGGIEKSPIVAGRTAALLFTTGGAALMQPAFHQRTSNGDKRLAQFQVV